VGPGHRQRPRPRQRPQGRQQLRDPGQGAQPGDGRLPSPLRVRGLKLSDAPAGSPAISQDKRFGRLVAFESGGNVYAVHRAEPYGENGTPWQPGKRELVSVGLGGAPANGPSSAPAVDGTSRVAPHCVAFVSDATDLGLPKTKNRNWKSAVTRANPPGKRQVYLHLFGGSTGIDRAMKKLTFLASATDKGRPGNGDSHSIAFAVNADRVTYASDATNLSSSDRNGATDIYQRTMSRRTAASSRSPRRRATSSAPAASRRSPRRRCRAAPGARRSGSPRRHRAARPATARAPRRA